MCQKWGLKINPNKCAILSPEQDTEIKVDGKNVSKVDEFIFLGSIVPDLESDVKRRISPASQAFGRLKKTIWTSRSISRNLIVRLYRALILLIAIYGSEAWTTREKEMDTLLVFEMKCLRTILGATRRDRLRNDDIRQRLGLMMNIRHAVVSQHLRWFGHIIKSDVGTRINASCRQDFNDSKRRGRPPKR